MASNRNYIQSVQIRWIMVEEESYLRKIPSLGGLKKLEFSKPVTFFVGDNGSGKSTLLEAIAVAYGFNPEGGTLNYQFSTYDDVSPLHKACNLTKGFSRQQRSIFLRAESFFNLSTKAKEYEDADGGSPLYGDKTLHDQSHGESFMSFIKSFGNGLYLMDEPEAALSQRKQMELLAWMMDTVKKGAQYIVCTHSPILLAYPGAEIISFDKSPAGKITYEESDCYTLTKLFIENRESVIRQLGES